MGRSTWEDVVDWSDPVRDLRSWSQDLLGGWVLLVQLTEVARGDALGSRQWAAAVERFDLGDSPATVEEANERWRGLVAAAWRVCEGYAERRRQALMAQERRRH